MHLQKENPIGKIHRWKTIASLIFTGYGLLVYGAITLDGWVKRRKCDKKDANKKSSP